MLINVYQAKTQLSKLLDRAAGGEEVVIARHGRPVAKLVPIERTGPPRKLGLFRGHIWVAEDFDGPLPEDVLRDFEGNS